MICPNCNAEIPPPEPLGRAITAARVAMGLTRYRLSSLLGIYANHLKYLEESSAVKTTTVDRYLKRINEIAKGLTT